MKKICCIVMSLAFLLAGTPALADRNEDRRKTEVKTAENSADNVLELPGKLAKKLEGYLVIKEEHSVLYENGKGKKIRTPAYCENDMMFIPAAVTAAFFGKEAVWSDTERTVKIDGKIIHPSETSCIIDGTTMIEAETLAGYIDASVVYSGNGIVILGHDELSKETIDEVTAALRDKFYVTADTTVNGDGSMENPFGGFGAAVKGLREYTAKGMSSDITVYLRSGLYTQDETVILGPEDSGKNGYNIIYKSYPGETAEIIAAKTVTGWKKASNGIYSADIDLKGSVNVLFENDMFAHKARYPNLGDGPYRDYYLKSNGHDKNKSTKFYFASGDLPYLNDTTGLQVTIFGGGEDGVRNWYSERRNALIDYREKSIEMSWLETYVMGKGSRYFIEGCKELLDTEGEFYCDEINRTLYYKPYNEDINAQTITYGTVNAPFCLEGHEGNPVKNIVFEDLKIGKTNSPSEIRPGRVESITFRNVEKCAVKNSEILMTGGVGITFINSKDSEITGNYVHDTGDAGIYIDCTDNYGIVEYTGNKIENNYVRNVGVIHREATGIMIRNSDYGTISNNLITDTPRMGILFTSENLATNFVGSEIRGEQVTMDNQFDFRNTIGNYIGYNDISNVLTDTQDGGALYSYGIGKDNVVENNRIHDFDVNFSMGYAIYGDDQSSYTTYRNNIVDNVNNNGGKGSLYAALITKGVGAEVINNFFLNNPNCKRGAYSTETKLCDEHNNITYMNNLTMNSSDQLHGQWEWYDDRFRICDFNMYYNDSGNYLIYNNKKANTYEEWKKISTDNGYMDNNSIAGENPCFVDYDGGDFRFRYDTAAYKIGICDIDQKNIGLREDFKFADREEELKTLFLESSTDGLKANIRLKTGETSVITPSARTVSGFFANLKNAVLTYKSSDETIARVDEKGTVTAVGTGIAQISVTAEKNGKTIESKVYILVNDILDKMEIKLADSILDNGGTTNIISAASSSMGYVLPVSDFVYKSSDEKVVEIDKEGRITAKAPGKAVITVTAAYKGITKSSSAEITVLNGVLDKINVTAEKTDAILVGEKVQLSFEAYLSNGIAVNGKDAKVSYESDDENIITVDETGVMTGKKEGRTVVTVYLEKDGFKKSQQLNVAVFEKYSGKLESGFKEVNFGTSHGYADFRDDGTILMRSTGDDFYGEADDGYYLYKDISGEKVTIEMSVKSLLKTSSNTAVGLTIRESASADSKNYTIRALADGRVISVWREENGGGSGYAEHGSGKFPIKLKIEKDGTDITSYVDFGNGYETAYNMNMKLGSYTAGIPMFSQYPLSTEAIIDDLIISE